MAFRKIVASPMLLFATISHKIKTTWWELSRVCPEWMNCEKHTNFKLYSKTHDARIYCTLTPELAQKLTVRSLHHDESNKTPNKIKLHLFPFLVFLIKCFPCFPSQQSLSLFRFWQGWLCSMKQMLYCQDVHLQLLLLFIAHFPWSSERNCTLSLCY